MSHNVGGADRIIRLILGVVLLCLALFQAVTGGWAIAFYIVGAIALVTGIVGWCGAWSLLGINTRGHKEAKAPGPAH
jgi:sugar phosphate permease